MMSGDTQAQVAARCAVVVIGRNEGSRLIVALTTIKTIGCPIVYVDSASSDDSVQQARAMGIEVIELEQSQGLSAAKARNAGARWVSEHYPNTELIQFIDGDCQMDPGWLPRAVAAMDGPDVVAVCGHCKEINPESSIYNKLCDMEWSGPVGPLESTGGNVMVRRSAFERVGGFDPSLVAGEEPDLCFRLRAQDGRIVRIDAEMVRHDADMHHFSQWWRRSLRGGYADAACHWKHRGRPGRFRLRALVSTVLWGLLLPVATVIVALLTAGVGVVLLVLYPVLGYRVWRRQRQQGISKSSAMLYTVACVLSKFPAILGIFIFHWRRLLGKDPQLIEHKPMSDRVQGRQSP